MAGGTGAGIAWAARMNCAMNVANWSGAGMTGGLGLLCSRSMSSVSARALVLLDAIFDVGGCVRGWVTVSCRDLSGDGCLGGLTGKSFEVSAVLSLCESTSVLVVL